MIWLSNEFEEDTPKEIEKKEEDAFANLLSQLYKELSKADTMNLEWEQKMITENMSYFKITNLFLLGQLKEMYSRFKNLQSESNQQIKDLINELNLLRNEIKEVENVRSFKVEIPSSWILKE